MDANSGEDGAIVSSRDESQQAGHPSVDGQQGGGQQDGSEQDGSAGAAPPSFGAAIMAQPAAQPAGPPKAGAEPEPASSSPASPSALGAPGGASPSSPEPAVSAVPTGPVQDG